MLDDNDFDNDFGAPITPNEARGRATQILVHLRPEASPFAAWKELYGRFDSDAHQKNVFHLTQLSTPIFAHGLEDVLHDIEVTANEIIRAANDMAHQPVMSFHDIHQIAHDKATGIVYRSLMGIRMPEERTSQPWRISMTPQWDSNRLTLHMRRETWDLMAYMMSCYAHTHVLGAALADHARRDKS